MQCADEYKFICKRPAHGIIYKASDDMLPKREAWLACNAWGGQLASIPTKNGEQELFQYLEPEGSYWVGLKNRMEGNIDGKKVWIWWEKTLVDHLNASQQLKQFGSKFCYTLSSKKKWEQVSCTDKK